MIKIRAEVLPPQPAFQGMRADDERPQHPAPTQPPSSGASNTLEGERGVRESQAAQEAQERQETCRRVDALLRSAHDAADGVSPEYQRWRSWWSGNCVESTFRNLHNAEALLASLYSPEELHCEIPEAVRRVREALTVDDPMRKLAERMLDQRDRVRCGHVGHTMDHIASSSADLSKLIEVGHTAADRQRAQLRAFRNVLLGSVLAVTVLLGLFIGLAAYRPNIVPLCFTTNQNPQSSALSTSPSPEGKPNVLCPTRSGYDPTPPGIVPDLESSWDFLAVAVLGLMGGVLSATLAIRGMRSNATPYNVSVPLALLKLPAGALTAVIGVLLLAGGFVPGFTSIDQQSQIVAYALLFGFAQQLFTQFVDQRARNLIAGVPTKARGTDAGKGSAART